MYIKNELSRGTPKNIIQSNLLSNGWNLNDITEALATLAVDVTSPVQSMPQISVNLKPQSTVQSQIKPQPWPVTSPKSKSPILTIFIILIVCVLGGGAFVYYKNLNSNVVPTNNQTQPVEDTTNVNSITTSTVRDVISTSTANSTDNIVDCGTSTDIQNLPEIKQKTADGVTITTKDYEQDKALVCFGNNLLVCNKAKIKFVTSKPDINQGVPSGMEIKNNDGQNCSVRLDIKEIVVNGKDLTNKYLECPFPIKDIPDIACPMGMCLKKGVPGSTGVGILMPLFFGIMAGHDALISEGCSTDF